jgi:hypothetical protein
MLTLISLHRCCCALPSQDEESEADEYESESEDSFDGSLDMGEDELGEEFEEGAEAKAAEAADALASMRQGNAAAAESGPKQQQRQGQQRQQQTLNTYRLGLGSKRWSRIVVRLVHKRSLHVFSI